MARPYLTIYCHSVLWEAWSLQPFMIFGCSCICTVSTDNLHLLMFPLWSPACDEGEDDAEEREIGRYGNWGWVGSVWAWHAFRGGVHWSNSTTLAPLVDGGALHKFDFTNKFQPLLYYTTATATTKCNHGTLAGGCSWCNWQSIVQLDITLPLCNALCNASEQIKVVKLPQ